MDGAIMWVDYTKATERALDLLAKNNVRRPPVDPVRIAASVGVRVKFTTFAQQDKNIAGFFDPKTNTIRVNEDEWPLRQNFTIAHELGHKVLHEEWARSNNYRMMYRDAEANNDNKYEREANRFAAHLLVPRFLLNRFWDQHTVEDLSEIFAVSVPVIKNRISSEYGVTA